MNFVEKFRSEIPPGTEVTVVKERFPDPSIILSVTKKVEDKEPFSLKIKKGEVEIRDEKTRKKEKPKFDTTIVIETDQTRYEDPEYLNFVKLALPVAVYDFGVERYGFRVDNPFISDFNPNKNYEQRKKEKEEELGRRNKKWREQVESGEEALIAIEGIKKLVGNFQVKLGPPGLIRKNINFINNVIGYNRDIHDFLYKTAIPIVLAGDVQDGIRVEPCRDCEYEEDDDPELCIPDEFGQYPLRVVAGEADNVFQSREIKDYDVRDLNKAWCRYSRGTEWLEEHISFFMELSFKEIIEIFETVISTETERIRQAGEPHVVRIRKYWERNTESEVFGTKK